MRSLLDKVNFYRELAIGQGKLEEYVNKELNDIDKLTKHVYNSSRIEGNTVSEGDTAKILTGLVPLHEFYGKYGHNDVMEIHGMIEANQLLIDNLEEKYLTEEFIKLLHLKVYEPVEEISKGIYEGQYRTYGSYTYRADGSKQEYLDERFIDDEMEDIVFYYNETIRRNLEDICLLKLDFIVAHPFGDGNGRTSRMLLNWALITNGFPPIIIKADKKREYIDTLIDYDDNRDHEPFTKLIANQLIEIYKEMLVTSENVIKGF